MKPLSGGGGGGLAKQMQSTCTLECLGTWERGKLHMVRALGSLPEYTQRKTCPHQEV